jgi:integrase
MTAVKLTKRLVEAAKPETKDLLLWDSELKGFCCKVTPRGKRGYFLFYRTREGQQRKPKLGDHGAITCEQARDLALKMLAAVNTGQDPSHDKQEARRSQTVAEFFEQYLNDYALRQKKPSSVLKDRRLMRCNILPILGAKKLHAVTRQDIARLHQSLAATPYEANRSLALLSKMFSLAEQWGARPDYSNPCRHVAKFKEHKRERFLSMDELNRLSDVLIKAEQQKTELPSVVATVRLLLLTGCRLMEILSLEWRFIDYSNATLNLPDSKSGKKTVYLAAPALAVLAGMPRLDNNPYVITGAKQGAHLVNMEKPWGRIRKQAGLEDVRLHDLRHTFASVGAGAGLSLPMIGKLLGHTQAQTTARYAHLAADPIKQAASMVADTIAGAMRGQSAEVIPLRPKQQVP